MAEEKRIHYSQEYIESQMPEYIVKACPRCGGRVQVFGMGPEGKADFSKIRMICWDCGKRQDFEENKAEKTYTEIDPIK